MSDQISKEIVFKARFDSSGLSDQVRATGQKIKDLEKQNGLNTDLYHSKKRLGELGDGDRVSMMDRAKFMKDRFTDEQNHARKMIELEKERMRVVKERTESLQKIQKDNAWKGTNPNDWDPIDRRNWEQLHQEKAAALNEAGMYRQSGRTAKWAWAGRAGSVATGIGTVGGIGIEMLEAFNQAPRIARVNEAMAARGIYGEQISQAYGSDPRSWIYQGQRKSAMDNAKVEADRANTLSMWKPIMSALLVGGAIAGALPTGGFSLMGAASALGGAALTGTDSVSMGLLTGGTTGMKAAQAKRLADIYGSNYEAEINSNQIFKAGVDRISESGQQSLNFRRKFNLSNTEYTNFLMPNGFTNEQTMSAAESILAAGGSTSGATGLSKSVNQMMAKGLLSAPQIAGGLSGIGTSDSTTTKIMEDMMAEGMRRGLNASELNKFTNVVTNVLASKAGVSSDSAAAITSNMAGYIASATPAGVNAAASAFQTVENAQKAISGIGGAIGFQQMRGLGLTVGGKLLLNQKTKSDWLNAQNDEEIVGEFYKTHPNATVGDAQWNAFVSKGTNIAESKLWTNRKGIHDLKAYQDAFKKYGYDDKRTRAARTNLSEDLQTFFTGNTPEDQKQRMSIIAGQSGVFKGPISLDYAKKLEKDSQNELNKSTGIQDAKAAAETFATLAHLTDVSAGQIQNFTDALMRAVSVINAAVSSGDYGKIKQGYDQPSTPPAVNSKKHNTMSWEDVKYRASHPFNPHG